MPVVSSYVFVHRVYSAPLKANKTSTFTEVVRYCGVSDFPDGQKEQEQKWKHRAKKSPRPQSNKACRLLTPHGNHCSLHSSRWGYAAYVWNHAAEQPQIRTLLISSHCQSLSNPPDWCFPPWSSISLLWIEFSSVRHWLNSLPIKAIMGEPRWMLLGQMGKNHQRLQLGKTPSSTVIAGTQLGTSHFLQWPCLCSTMLFLTQQGALPQAQGCGQLNNSSAWNVRVCGSVPCSMDSCKEIPGGNLIFGLMVYISKVNKPNTHIGLA